MGGEITDHCCGNCRWWDGKHQRLIENRLLRHALKETLSECLWTYNGEFPDSFSEKQRGQIFSDTVMFSNEGKQCPCFEVYSNFEKR